MNKKTLVAGLAGFVLGALWLIGMRALLAYPETAHYHANFGVFINGERQDFDGFGYYEEVQACSQDESANPRSRVHMHQPDNDVLHAHAPGVTWGNFFENLGWSVSDDTLVTPDAVYVNGQGGQLAYILNGHPVTGIAERVIGSEDRLLVSYSEDGVNLDQLESQIGTSAVRFNQSSDPAGCGANVHPTVMNRLRHAVFN